MKASLKFREEQKPLFKSKVPISILSLPFQSGLIAGDSKELCLTLATLFDYGPSFRVSYRPNDAFNPFSLTIKSGIGHFGSPFNAPMTMSAQFNLIDDKKGINPRFMINFKPNFGDFSVKKSSQSNVISDFNCIKNGVVFEEDDGELIEKPWSGRRITSLPLRKTVESVVSGMELGAKTSLPVKNGVVLGFRWGVKFPSEGLKSWFNNPTGWNLPRGVPVLTLNKIGIEHVAKVDRKEVELVGANEVVTRGGGGSVDVAEACFGLKREIETLRFEISGLGKALEELKVEFGKGRKLVKCDGDDCGEISV